eukprot:TRINITY_DN67833_c5_g2_i1.p1 TRINITY_DN67833_c5_g2~~TRINITY_DN67833_c5_g2_i1.p1  ORF type:complete len:212 (+),score=50.49 TRINITY_DN67833_c5_g2_i1:265-900(+)
MSATTRRGRWSCDSTTTTKNQKKQHNSPSRLEPTNPSNDPRSSSDPTQQQSHSAAVDHQAHRDRFASRTVLLSLFASEATVARAEPVTDAASPSAVVNQWLLWFDFPSDIVFGRFCGVSLKVTIPSGARVSCVVFMSGAVVVTGAKSRQEARACYDHLSELLPKYEVGREYRPFTAQEQAVIDHRQKVRRQRNAEKQRAAQNRKVYTYNIE